MSDLEVTPEQYLDDVVVPFAEMLYKPLGFLPSEDQFKALADICIANPDHPDFSRVGVEPPFNDNSQRNRIKSLPFSLVLGLHPTRLREPHASAARAVFEVYVATLAEHYPDQRERTHQKMTAAVYAGAVLSAASPGTGLRIVSKNVHEAVRIARTEKLLSHRQVSWLKDSVRRLEAW